MVVLSGPRTARADDPTLSACIAANEASIQRRSEHKLVDARAQSQKCATDACPALLRGACAKRIAQIDAALPTIAFDVKDATGAVVAVTVSMDGHPLPDAPPGTALPADPGEHRFTFEVAGQPPVDRTIVLREGEHDRHEPVVVVLAPPSPAPAPLPVTPAPGPDAGSSRWSTQKTLAVVASGAGVAGIAVGSVFALMARSSWSASQNECPSSANCLHYAQAVNDHDAAASSATVATIAVAAGAAALAAGAVLWFTAPRAETGKAPASSVRVTPAAGPGSASLFVAGSF